MIFLRGVDVYLVSAQACDKRPRGRAGGPAGLLVRCDQFVVTHLRREGGREVFLINLALGLLAHPQLHSLDRTDATVLSVCSDFFFPIVSSFPRGRLC